MKKYTVKHLITSALLSLTALVVGYALPDSTDHSVI